MKIYMDLHIHSSLSPCGDEDMTPNNIINMAYIKGLHAIAITDHNSCENVTACAEVGNKVGIVVIPGMELQTREDIHVVCLFRKIEDALEFQREIYSLLPNMENKEEVFGKQLILNEKDETVGHNKRLLLSAANISFDEAFYKVQKLQGAFIPAHVERDTFGVVANLGFIPPYLPIKTLEYHSKEKADLYIQKGLIDKKYNLIHSSDAHYLEDILEAEFFMELEACSINKIIDMLSIL